MKRHIKILISLGISILTAICFATSAVIAMFYIQKDLYHGTIRLPYELINRTAGINLLYEITEDENVDDESSEEDLTDEDTNSEENSESDTAGDDSTYDNPSDNDTLGEDSDDTDTTEDNLPDENSNSRENSESDTAGDDSRE